MSACKYGFTLCHAHTQILAASDKWKAAQGRQKGKRSLQCPNLISSCVSLTLSGLEGDWASQRHREWEGGKAQGLGRGEAKEEVGRRVGREHRWVHTTSRFISSGWIPSGETPLALLLPLLSHYSTHGHRKLEMTYCRNRIYWHLILPILTSFTCPEAGKYILDLLEAHCFHFFPHCCWKGYLIKMQNVKVKKLTVPKSDVKHH